MLRFIICSTDEEISTTTDYFEKKGIDYILQDPIDPAKIGCVAPSLTMIWYNGDESNQNDLIELTSGQSLF